MALLVVAMETAGSLLEDKDADGVVAVTNWFVSLSSYVAVVVVVAPSDRSVESLGCTLLASVLTPGVTMATYDDVTISWLVPDAITSLVVVATNMSLVIC